MKRRKQRKLGDYLNPRKARTARERKPVRRVKITNWRDKIWRSSIGHYGGMHVKVPEEHWKEFSHAIPKRMFPRKVTPRSATEFTDFGEQRFHRRFPKSKGKMREIYFATNTKGYREFDKLFPGQSSVIDPFEERGNPPLTKPNMERVLSTQHIRSYAREAKARALEQKIARSPRAFKMKPQSVWLLEEMKAGRLWPDPKRKRSRRKRKR